MAYRRYAAKRRSTSRRTNRKSRGYRIRRTSRKRTTRKMPSKKMILNLTSRKKRDTMHQFTNISATSQQGSTTYTPNTAIITGGTNSSAPIIWCATARDNDPTGNSASGNVFQDATRTSSNCFMRGLSETVQIQVSNGVPWLWRRICFTYKGINAAMPALGSQFFLANESSDGWVRVVNMVPNNTYKDTLEGILFRGAANKDWLDAMTAPVDTGRVTLKYDKTRTIASGNEAGCIRKYKLWHGMNKSLVYDDDENGGGKTVSYYSVQDKAGMGDYLVVDYFKPRIGTAASDQLAFSCNSTLYWHER